MLQLCPNDDSTTKTLTERENYTHKREETRKGKGKAMKKGET